MINIRSIFWENKHAGAPLVEGAQSPLHDSKKSMKDPIGPVASTLLFTHRSQRASLTLVHPYVFLSKLIESGGSSGWRLPSSLDFRIDRRGYGSNLRAPGGVESICGRAFAEGLISEAYGAHHADS
jgi:hypothetical protein